MNNKNYKIEIFNKQDMFDAMGETLKHDIIDFGVNEIKSVKVSQLYRISGKLSYKETKSLGEHLLTDPVTQDYLISNNKSRMSSEGYVVEVWYKPGVTDAVGESALKASKDMGIKTVDGVKTGFKYIIYGNRKLTYTKVEKICNRLLTNSVIQTYTINK